MGIKPVIHSDTAGAAKDIAARGERHVGAIASALAGEIYGLDTVQDSITDKLTNTTRFLVMSREHTVPKEITAPAMTTIIFEVRSVPAVLYKALGGFATNGINLTKLESYMLDGSMNAARFYVDCEGHPETASMKLALEELQFDQRSGVAGVAMNLADDDFLRTGHFGYPALRIENVRSVRRPVYLGVGGVEHLAQFGPRKAAPSCRGPVHRAPEDHRSTLAGLEIEGVGVTGGQLCRRNLGCCA